MKTRLDDQLGGGRDEGSDDTWIDEVTLPDFDATTLDGEVWPPRHAAPRRQVTRAPLSAFEWR